MSLARPVPELDAVIHAPVRLTIMSGLVHGDEVEFTVLRERTGTSDGNLATHLQKLEKAGYLKVRKRFVRRKPQTLYQMTDSGRIAFLAYVDALQALLPER